MGVLGSTLSTATVLEGSGSLAHTGTTAGFYSATPIVRPSAYTQTYSTATRTHDTPVAAQPASTAATNVTPFGYTTATQANAIKEACRDLVTDMANVKQVLNQVIDDLQALGLLQ